MERKQYPVSSFPEMINQLMLHEVQWHVMML